MVSDQVRPGRTNSICRNPEDEVVDENAWASGERVLFVPTFYAWGRV